RIYISFNAWSLCSNLYILLVVAYFTNQLSHLWALLISLPEIYSSKTSKNIAALLSGVFKRYNITYKLGFLIADNTTINNRVIDLLSTRCSGYILNLIVKVIIFSDGISLFKRRLISISKED
ncbi:hypothetical protein V2W45_1254311, partial [Cenococcum geophilum]